MTAALAIHPDAAAAFPGGLAPYGRTLVLSHPDAIPLPELLRPATLAPLADRFGAGLVAAGAHPDRRAALSMWSQFYLLALVPPAVMSALAAPADPEADLVTASAVLGPDGRPVTLCLPGPGHPAPTGCPAERLTPLLRRHLQPLGAALAAAGLPQRVFWGNALATLTWTLGIALVPPARVDALRGAVRAAPWVDGDANPLFPGACAASRGWARSVCCLRHRLPGMATCADCPRNAARVAADRA